MKFVYGISVIGENADDKNNMVTIPFNALASMMTIFSVDFTDALKKKGFNDYTLTLHGKENLDLNMSYNMLLREVFDLKGADWLCIIGLTNDFPEDFPQLLFDLISKMDPTYDSIYGEPEHGLYLIPRSVGSNNINFEQIGVEWAEKLKKEQEQEEQEEEDEANTK